MSAPITTAPSIITVAAAAELLGATKSAIYALVRDGKVRHQKLGKRFMIHKHDLMLYIEKSWVRGQQP